MRGAQIVKKALENILRIIPADAGSTVCGGCFHSRRGEHPRGCGEHRFSVFCRLRNVGSSPRMRGALLVSSALSSSARIIPADAGSTLLFTADQLWFEDHPRGCGEHSAPSCARSLTQGSSPRMRGAPLNFFEIMRPTWIIPADAGSTTIQHSPS